MSASIPRKNDENGQETATAICNGADVYSHYPDVRVQEHQNTRQEESFGGNTHFSSTSSNSDTISGDDSPQEESDEVS